jgi:hypothetical protein
LILNDLVINTLELFQRNFMLFRPTDLRQPEFCHRGVQLGLDQQVQLPQERISSDGLNGRQEEVQGDHLRLLVALREALLHLSNFPIEIEESMAF